MVKIVLLALLLGLIVFYLKSINSELFSLGLIASGIILVFISLNYISATFDFVNEIVNLTGVNKEHYYIIIKIIAIGYLIEFASSSLEDLGLKSLSVKLIFLGRIIILSLSAPIIMGVFRVVTSIMQ